MAKPLTRASRRHRIGRASVKHVLANTQPVPGINPATGDKTLAWIGVDERGRELEIFAIDLPDYVLVIHVMPTIYRKKT